MLTGLRQWSWRRANGRGGSGSSNDGRGEAGGGSNPLPDLQRLRRRLWLQIPAKEGTMWMGEWSRTISGEWGVE